MSEAVEMFLHQVIIHEGMPFDAKAISVRQLEDITELVKADRKAKTEQILAMPPQSLADKNKRIKKVFSGSRTPSKFKRRNPLKKTNS